MVTMHMRPHVIFSFDPRVNKVIRLVLRPWPLSTGRAARNLFSITAFGQCIGASFLGSLLVHPAYGSDFWPSFNQAPKDPIEQGKVDSANDPAEAINRQIFQGNKFLDDNVIKPVTRAYVDHVPDGVRHGIHNFVNNLDEPVVFVNDILQGNIKRAWNTTQRFAVNTTVGGIGFFDVAETWGRPHHDADLGQTFGVWGIGAGPAIQIPVLGPSNLRDTVGLMATSAVAPVAAHGAVESIVSYTQLGSDSVSTLDSRAKMLPNTDALEKTSQDYYASTRLIKAQLRAKLVEEGKAGFVSRDEAINAESPRH